MIRHRLFYAFTATCTVLLLTIGSSAQAADCYVKQVKRVATPKTRVTYPTYKTPVKVLKTADEKVYGIVGYKKETRFVSKPIIVTETIDVYGTAYLHTNYWTWGTTQCSGIGEYPDCGSHGDDWLDHETQYYNYVIYSYDVDVTQYIEVTVNEYVPIYGWKTISKKYYVTEWVTTTSKKPVTEYYTEYSYIEVNVPCPVVNPKPSPSATPRATPNPTASIPAIAQTVALTYRSGGGSGFIPGLRAAPGTSVPLATGSSGFIREGYVLSGWSDGKGTYAPGGRYTLKSDTVMTAIWSRSGEERAT